MSRAAAAHKDLLTLWGKAEPSPLATIVAERRASAVIVDDFITANPFDHGFQFSPGLFSAIVNELAASSVRYGGEPLGRMEAREAVARVHGGVLPDKVMITPGTSMAYFYLFRLLARPGAEILCPAPTYPLFDDLARIAGVNVRRYHLRKQQSDSGVTRWAVDLDDLRFQLTPHTCAIVIISPHNPTGTIITEPEMSGICRIAEEANIPVIMDEVFRTYRRNEGIGVIRPSACSTGLSVVLNGLSKSHFLPGVKLGWLVVEGGTDSEVDQLMNALEYVSDSFLPVNDLAQAITPALLSGDAMDEAGRLQDMQRESLAWRLEHTSGWRTDVPESGPYLCIPLQGEHVEDDVVVSQLLMGYGALFHPGNLYGFEEPYMIATVYNHAEWPEATDAAEA